MSEHATIADWIDQLTSQDAYGEATELRRALVAAAKGAGQGLSDLTAETAAQGLMAYFPGAQARWGGLPALDDDGAAKAGALTVEWLKLFDDGRSTLGLLSVDDYQGVLHALRCAMRGTGLELPKPGQQADSPLLGGKFDLKGSL